MPQIDLIPVPLYDVLQPYHADYDNLPLRALMTRTQLVNFAVDINSQILRDAIGTAGTLSARLNQSIESSGNLKKQAVDDVLHSIGAHTDGVYAGTNYVRMKLSERDKLALIANEATNMELHFQILSNVVVFEQGPVKFEPSESISWSLTAPNRIRAELVFPLNSAHRHYYNVKPAAAQGPPDHKTYKTGISTPFSAGSLRVFINGVKMADDEEIYHPGNLVSDPWKLNKFTPDADRKGFSLLNAITADDAIRIEFDIPLL